MARRLVLFDIDGTLIDTGGVGPGAMVRALTEVYDRPVQTNGYSMAGRTDVQIAVELVGRAGLSHAATLAGLDALWPVYARELQVSLERTPAVTCPGVHEVLAALAADPRWLLGLLTGNQEDAAWIKMRAVHLDQYFSFGAFGGATIDRNTLGPVALAAAHAAVGAPFDPATTIVVGDTPADVACAHHAGMRAVALATGRYDAQALASCGPAAVLIDMSDTASTLDVLHRT